jgi:hypothetical protein
MTLTWMIRMFLMLIVLVDKVNTVPSWAGGD